MKVGKREKETFFKMRRVENQHISSRFTAVSNEKKGLRFQSCYRWSTVCMGRTLMEPYFSLNCVGLRANI